MKTLEFKIGDMELNVKLKVTKEQIDNTLITALEGGSNYWYAINDDDLRECEKWLEKNGKRNESIHYAFLDALYQNPELSIPIYDCEEIDSLDLSDYNNDVNKMYEKTNPLGHLSWNKIKMGLNVLFEYDKSVFNQEFGDSYSGDSTSADIVFQYIIMGEVVYG